MKHWIWSVRKEDWPVIEAEKKWAIGVAARGEQIVKGDRMIINITKSCFRGIYRVASDWHPATVDWPNDVNGTKPNSEVDLKPIQLGFAYIKNIKDDLEFIKNKGNPGTCMRGHKFGPANFGRAISEHDSEIIQQELKKVQEPQSRRR